MRSRLSISSPGRSEGAGRIAYRYGVVALVITPVNFLPGASGVIEADSPVATACQPNVDVRSVVNAQPDLLSISTITQSERGSG